ncbi:sensor histidine kinase KdpD [uncultured Faecalibaculum sp.]|uniref:sensor histidine kinase n=1 Tax=uncultured Faecalibaculum sp. TaxID=1729681 RepID=UPI00262FBF2B|nr:sensor histidine kinase KdpD [uncultured Faecalibaculum sp.]
MAEVHRNTPDTATRRGRLKIFFGYAAGTGKTWAMLEAGKAAAEKGADVVIGYLEPHDRPETAAKARGLEQVDCKVLDYRGLRLREMDTDAVIARAPRIALVDELAHTNAAGCRHTRRYRDIQELLVHGIDVYTTLNVQHLESLNDQVAAITGILVQERIPDDVFDMADEIELIDIEVTELLDRLREGKIYHADQAGLAAKNFFTRDNLLALREIAMRRCADRLNRIAPETHARDHVLVCLSPSPSNARIIRSAARMAFAFDARFSALYIQTGADQDMEEEDSARLQENLRLANRLGASIESAWGSDVAAEIGAFARQTHVTKIVIGRRGRKSAFGPASFAQKLAASAPESEIFIIPDPESSLPRKKNPSWIHRVFGTGQDAAGLGLQLLVVAGAFAVALAARKLGFSQPNIMAIFIFASLIGALCARKMWQAVLTWFLCILLFGYRFTSPVLSLVMFDKGYLVAFAAMLVISLVVSRQAIRLRQQARASSAAAPQSALLYEASQSLQALEEDEEICTYITRRIAEYLGRSVVFYQNKAGSLGKPVYSGHTDPFLGTREQAVALWTLKNNRRAGASTDTLSAARGLYLAVRHRHNIFGVLGIDLEGSGLSTPENVVVLSLLGQAALALENNENARQKEREALHAQHQQMKTSLLRSISHDLRTPLTTISASADLLTRSSCTPQQQHKLAAAISQDARWLRDTVENLLSLTRLDDETLRLNRQYLEVEEAVEQALFHTAAQRRQHPVDVDVALDCAGSFDGQLLVQMFVNLIGNTVTHTPKGTRLRIQGTRDQDRVILDVCDNGPGVCQQVQEHLFEPFVPKSSTISDSYRSMGLGLSLVHSIVLAHQGSIAYRDGHPGACFHIELPCSGETDETIDTECGG